MEYTTKVQLFYCINTNFPPDEITTSAHTHIAHSISMPTTNLVQTMNDKWSQMPSQEKSHYVLRSTKLVLRSPLSPHSHHLLPLRLFLGRSHYYIIIRKVLVVMNHLPWKLLSESLWRCEEHNTFSPYPEPFVRPLAHETRVGRR